MEQLTFKEIALFCGNQIEFTRNGEDGKRRTIEPAFLIDMQRGNFTNCKPILRTIDQMTQEEIDWIGKHDIEHDMFDSTLDGDEEETEMEVLVINGKLYRAGENKDVYDFMGDRDCIGFRTRINHGTKETEGGKPEKVITEDKEPSVFWTIDSTQKPEVFIWLLNKGFDVFGWIEEGLASKKA